MRLLSRLRSGVLAAALAVAVPMSVLSAVREVQERTEETIELAEQEQSEVRSAAGVRPRLTEPFVSAARSTLAPGESWELITADGGCRGPDGMLPGNNSPRIRYANPFFWLAFRLLPNPTDCTDPDLVFYWNTPPPEGSDVVADGRHFAVVRR